LRSTRAAQDAQVIPVTASSTESGQDRVAVVEDVPVEDIIAMLSPPFMTAGSPATRPPGVAVRY
jgi:hypothetical protein